MSPRDTEVVIFAETRGMVHHEIFRGILMVELGARVLIAESYRQTDAVKVMDGSCSLMLRRSRLLSQIL